MNVLDIAEVRMWAPRARFALQRTPFYVHTDFPWESGVANAGQSEGVRFNYDLQCVHPAPLFVPHHQAAGYYVNGGTPPPLPTTVWTATPDSVPIGFRPNNPVGFLEMYVEATKSGAMFDVEWYGATLGMVYLWKRGDPDQSKDWNPEQKFTSFRVGVGSPGWDAVTYSVRFEGTNDVRIARATWNSAGDTFWTDLGPLAGGADIWSSQIGSAVPQDNDDLARPYNYLEFRLLAGRLAVMVGSQDEPYYFDESRIDSNGDPIWKIQYGAIRAYDWQTLACSGHPLKWQTHNVWTSAEIPIGFYSTRHGNPIAEPAGVVPSGCDCVYVPSQSTIDGPIVQYTMDITAPEAGMYKDQPYADWAACVRSVELVYTGSSSFSPASPAHPEPESTRVSHVFDPTSLQIESTAVLEFNATRPTTLPDGSIGTWGQWMMNRGQSAIEVWRSRTLPSGMLSPLELVFTGYGGTQGELIGSEGRVSYRMTCRSRRRQMKSPRWALPWMDGWNVYYAMAYLAQLGGYTPDDLGFAHLVPPVPFGYGSDLGDGEGGPAYYLPVGAVGSVLTRNSGMDIWDLMSKIASSIGFMLFPDVAAILQFRKFRLPGSVKRTFYETDAESALGNLGGGLEGCWNISIGKDMDDVRSESILVGVNAYAPQWNPLVFKWTDDRVVDDATAYNHLGYPNPAAWLDSQFANQEFGYEASLAMQRFFTLPGIDVRITTWSQPDLFPLDVIKVNADRFGVSNIPFLVTAVDDVATKAIGACTIKGRFVPA